MFRNVTGVQEAVVHNQSNDSLIVAKHPMKLIKDVQSDDIAQKYPTLKKTWIDEREELIEHLKYLQKQKTYPEEIQRIRSLIECFNELIEHGEVSRNCRILIDGMNKKIQPSPETYAFTKKPLGNKMIRLPRHISKTTMDIINPFKKNNLEIHHLHRANEKLEQQVNPQGNFQEEPIEVSTDTDETTTSSVSSEKLEGGLRFYLVAEPFRHEKTRKKHYLTSSILE